MLKKLLLLVKAVEKAWISAGKPKEFTVKIYEEPQKNFIGLTVKPAKVGIFFTEAPAQKTSQKQPEPRHKKVTAEEPSEQKPRHVKKEAPKREARTAQPEPRPAKQAAEQAPAELEQRQGPIWSDDMIDTIKNWMHEMLPMMDLDHIPFSINAHHFHLKIVFDKSLFEDKNREKYLFASLSSLLLSMLKRQYKRPLKGL